MKKLYLIGILIILMLSLTFTSVYAITATVNINGEATVKAGTTNKISVSIQSSDTIGGIEGKLVTGSNITKISEQNITGKNGWTVTYNSETGIFNAFKATGTKGEEIFEIEYTVGSQEGSAKIELKNLVVTDINYDEEQLEDVSKTISIAKKESDEPGDDERNQTPSSNTNSQNTTPSNTQSKNISVKNTDTTASKTILPKAGIAILIIPAVLIIIVSLGSYLGYRKYKGIK